MEVGEEQMVGENSVEKAEAEENKMVNQNILKTVWSLWTGHSVAALNQPPAEHLQGYGPAGLLPHYYSSGGPS